MSKLAFWKLAKA